MKSRLAKFVPSWLLPPLTRPDLRTSTAFADIGEAGPLIAGAFQAIAPIPGWFNVDDCSHFHLVLEMQKVFGIMGDLLEIGSYHGRSAAMMSRYLRPSERIVVCDAFDTETEDHDHYDNLPSPQTLRTNLFRLNPHLLDPQIVIHHCLSSDLRLASTERFRFIHIDGGHSSEIAFQDLILANRHLADLGVIVVDDYHNREWPDVTVGVDRFLAQSTGPTILGDLNRHGAIGRKLYLIRA